MIFANPSYDLPYFDLFADQYELKINLIGHRQRSKCSYCNLGIKSRKYN